MKFVSTNKTFFHTKMAVEKDEIYQRKTMLRTLQGEFFMDT
jgi:hypothetical protein